MPPFMMLGKALVTENGGSDTSLLVINRKAAGIVSVRLSTPRWGREMSSHARRPRACFPAASCLPHFIQVLRDYGLPALFAPAMSISEFESLPAVFTLSDVLLFWLVCRIAACLCMGSITLTLGRVFGNLLPALFVSAVGYCLPALLSLSGMDGGIEWLGFWPLFHAAALLTTQGYGGAEGLPYNYAWMALLFLMVALLGVVTLWGYLRDSYEWKGLALDVTR